MWAKLQTAVKTKSHTAKPTACCGASAEWLIFVIQLFSGVSLGHRNSNRLYSI
jgi:hypothetical protein